MSRPRSSRAFAMRLGRIYAWFTVGFVLFVAGLAVLEVMGMPRQTIGYVFLAATILLYAVIGIVSRTSRVAVRVPHRDAGPGVPCGQ